MRKFPNYRDIVKDEHKVLSLCHQTFYNRLLFKTTICPLRYSNHL